MLEREKKLTLYEIYKNLLTEKQREYFEYYYYEDYSLSEISKTFKVSKAIIGKTITIVEDKLYKYEDLLKINELQEKLKTIAENTKDDNTKKELDSLIK